MPLTDDQEAEISDVFSRYAKGGGISSKELPTAVRAGGLNPTEADLVLWQGEVKGTMDLAAFKKFMGSKFDSTNDSTEEIIDAFRAFDTSGNGYITEAELRHILTSMGEKLTEKEVNTLISEADSEGGKINYVTLAEMIFGGSN